MDKTILVANDIENGKQLVIRLEQSNFEFNAAMWFLFGTGDWHFLIASQCVDQLGPKKCYESIQAIINEIPENQRIPLELITVMSQNDNLIRLLRSAIRAEGISQIRFSKNTINGVFIDDALIYRIF
jgi:hypothetical protein